METLMELGRNLIILLVVFVVLRKVFSMLGSLMPTGAFNYMFKPEFSTSSTSESEPPDDIHFQQPDVELEIPLELPLQRIMGVILPWAREGRGTRDKGDTIELDEDGKYSTCFWNNSLWVVTPNKFYQYARDGSRIEQAWKIPSAHKVHRSARLTSLFKRMNTPTFLPIIAIDSTRLLWVLRGHLADNYVEFPVIFDRTNAAKPWKILTLKTNSFRTEENYLSGGNIQNISGPLENNELVLLAEWDAGAIAHIDDYIMVRDAYRINLKSCSYQLSDDQDNEVKPSQEPFANAGGRHLYNRLPTGYAHPEMSRKHGKIYFDIEDKSGGQLQQSPAFSLPECLENAGSDWLKDTPCMNWDYNHGVLVSYDFWKGTHATFRMWKVKPTGNDNVSSCSGVEG